jgi:flavodoxin
MKALVTYYSFSGNTCKVMNIFAGVLRAEGDVKLQRLLPKDEIKDFLGQCMAARSGKRSVLQDGIDFDASHYDIVVIASPVWAFAPTPAVNSFLDGLTGLNGKRVVVLLTSGSGLGVKKCFKNMRVILENKGASTIDEINIPDKKQKDENFIKTSIENILKGEGEGCESCRIL